MCACEWRAGDRQATTAAEGADEGQPSPVISFPKALSQVEPQAPGAPPPRSSQAFRCNAAALNSRLPGAPPATRMQHSSGDDKERVSDGLENMSSNDVKKVVDGALCHLCPLILKTHYIWRGIQEIMDEEMDEDVIVKAVDCSNQSEVCATWLFIVLNWIYPLSIGEKYQFVQWIQDQLSFKNHTLLNTSDRFILLAYKRLSDMHICNELFFPAIFGFIQSINRFKLCKVRSVQFGQKGIPYLNTYDGRTIRYPDPLIKANDTIKIDLETNKIMDFIKLYLPFHGLHQVIYLVRLNVSTNS
ncbi:40S ribosomal protein S4 [Zea mays]|uniref:40S ribosomal protein S4 n=1 Tax=Zea mays TaxID=4577 RepID=A0A3L6E7X2_MAIZE|nr:40S ribosomal protein S4 [Zea mays]